MNSDKVIQDAPLLAALLNYADQRRISLHMPGHQGGQDFPDPFRLRLAEIDATELIATDDLNQPSGPAAVAMQAAAAAFGASQTLFVTGGSTTALYAMVTAFCPKGSKIILPRNVHRSILNIALLLDLTVVFLPPEKAMKLRLDEDALIPMVPPQAATLVQVLERHPDARAVLVTSPDYFGICPDLMALAKVTENAGCPLLVDEAHGAHLCFAPAILPVSALAAGAAASVQSAHKTLPALTQGAYLHLGAGAARSAGCATAHSGLHQADIDNGLMVQHLRQCLSLYQTSSPSLMIGASLDYARAFMSRYGSGSIEATLEAIDRFGQSLSPELHCSKTSRQLTGGINRDPMRVVIDVAETGYTGLTLLEKLSRQGIDIEMADYRRLVLIPDLLHASDTLPAVAAALNAICMDSRTGAVEGRQTKTSKAAWIDKDRALYDGLATSPDEMLRPESPILTGRPVGSVTLDAAAGAVSAEAVIPYPPGIPLIWPGETLTGGRLALLRDLLENGFCLHGIQSLHGGESLRVAT